MSRADVSAPPSVTAVSSRATAQRRNRTFMLVAFIVLVSFLAWFHAFANGGILRAHGLLLVARNARFVLIPPIPHSNVTICNRFV